MMRLTFILSFFFLTINIFARQLKVGKGQSYISIRVAIASAVAGDTVMVFPGKYAEQNIIVDKPVVLIGINHPVLDGEHKYEVISVKSSNVVVDGFQVQNSGVSSIEDYAGIKVYNKTGVIIRNNILINTFFGIYIQNGKQCIIQSNTLTASAKQEQESGNGIHCWKSDSLLIADNTISGHRDGIYFEFVTNSIIRNNFSHKNIRYGLHFMFSNDDTYISNTFKNNGAGVAVMFSHHVTMLNNSFLNNWGDAAYGILLKEIADSKISGNKFMNNTSGIYMEGTSRISVHRNLFQSNGWGLKVQASCMDIELKYNNFFKNTFDVSTNGSLMLNHFENNYWDKYEGYDLNKDKIGDVPYRPVSLYSTIVEKMPVAMVLFRSFMSSLLDKAEKIFPSITPEQLIDNKPLIKPNKL